MRVEQIHTRFLDLTKRLKKEIKKNNHKKAENIALQQQLLIEKIGNAHNNEPSFKFAEQWDTVLKNYQSIITLLESDLTNLNSSTKQALRRLDGYSKR